MSSADLPQAIDEAWEGPVEPPTRPPAILRGNARGLEIVVDGTAATDAIAEMLTARLNEAPAFFRGSDVRVRVEDGPLPSGGLARLDEIATRFDLRIVEVGAARKAEPEPELEAVPVPDLAAGSAPAPSPPEPAVDLGPVLAAIERDLAATETVAEAGGTRLMVGPVRSGVVLEHDGHLVVAGDVNPGAEVLASGNIIVLGRLRGIAHAGIGRDTGFILALQLEPQQLRVGRLVARAGDAEAAGAGTEIAYVTGTTIVVERYAGKLPPGLATSI